jgi:predicted O-methyltransferase YrrM
MSAIIPVRPLVPLYRPDEHFEISARGLDEWRRSEAYARVVAAYKNYPPRSLQSNEARALLQHLIVMRRPEQVLEIGTYHVGTTEVMAPALWETGQGRLDTIDPFGAERAPALIAELPAELQERISFQPQTSAIYFDEAVNRGALYDLVLIDGNHEFENALFDLLCAARLMRPGGFVVLDNIEQPGPRLATKLFLERSPEWIDVADVVKRMDPADPFAMPPPSLPDTKFYLLQAPSHHLVGQMPMTVGPVEVDRAEVDGIDLAIAAPAHGTLHVHVYVRTFGLVEPEELEARLVVPLDVTGPQQLRIPFDKALRTAHADPLLNRRVEIGLAFVADHKLALTALPQPYPAKWAPRAKVRPPEPPVVEPPPAPTPSVELPPPEKPPRRWLPSFARRRRLPDRDAGPERPGAAWRGSRG